MRRAAGLACLAIGLLALACAVDAPEGEGGEAAVPAPAFTLPDLDGRLVSLEAFRGRLVFVDFWATWCVPCIYQIPVLNEFYAAYRDDGVVVLGIAVDAEGRRVVAPFAAEQDIRYPVLLGDEALAWRYGAPGFPALAIVARDGLLDSIHVGVIDREELEKAVERLGAADAPG